MGGLDDATTIRHVLQRHGRGADRASCSTTSGAEALGAFAEPVHAGRHPADAAQDVRPAARATRRCTPEDQDRADREPRARRPAARSRVVELDTGHDVMISAPGELAAVSTASPTLARLTRSVRADADRDHRGARRAARAVRGWVERHCPPAVPARAARRRAEALPAVLGRARGAGLARAARRRGARRLRATGSPELAVVLEELGRAVAPGPVRCRPCSRPRWSPRSTNDAAREARCSRGSPAARLVGAVGGGAGLRPRRRGRPTAACASRARCARSLGAHLADVLVAPCRVGDEARLGRARPRDPASRDASCRASTRRAGSPRSTVDGVRGRRRRAASTASTGDAVRRPRRGARRGRAVGVAQWCVDTAAEYAKERVQFGRPIGQFQGVKHRCADMLGRVELARAAAWDAARAVDDADDGASLRRGGRGRARVRRRVRERQGLRAGARRHRLHVGARRAPVPAARDRRCAASLGPLVAWRARAARARARRRRAAGSTRRPRPEADGAARPRCARSSPRSRTLDADEQRAPHRRRRLHHADVAAAVGPRRDGASSSS